MELQIAENNKTYSSIQNLKVVYYANFQTLLNLENLKHNQDLNILSHKHLEVGHDQILYINCIMNQQIAKHFIP